MKQSVWTTTSTSQAQAFITKRKQRLKQINRNVYLKDGDEYEIELFNPNPAFILAKIRVSTLLWFQIHFAQFPHLTKGQDGNGCCSFVEYPKHPQHTNG